MLERDPRDPRQRERLAGSTLASLIVHAVLAALLFSLAASSSQQGATETVEGATLVTIEQRAPAVAQAVPVKTAAPAPNVPRIAPVVHHAPIVVPAHQPQPPQRHELSRFSPTAPPNPTPEPQASLQPNPQPTVAIVEMHPQNDIAAVPTVMPSIAVRQVAVKPPPTAAPTIAPTITPTATPAPRTPAPSAPPTIKPATPAPTARPTAVPTVAPTAVAVATVAPKATAQPVVPHPSSTPATVAARGAAATPAPKGRSSPGPHAGNGSAKVAREAPIKVRATPRPAHGGGSGNSLGSGIRNNLNSLLAGMIPHNTVDPTSVRRQYKIALNGSMDPTPPPDVLARTKYIFEENGDGGDAQIKMWVTSTHRSGPLLMCDGWLVRYPQSSQPSFIQGTMAHPASGGIAVHIGGAKPGRGPPIVEGEASVSCSEHALVPFAGPSPSSP